MKLLLVEDEERMSMALCELLKMDEYEVETANNGITAFQMLQNGAYDAIIMDIMLPGMSGFEVVKKARGLGITSPILLLSAKSDVDDKVIGLDSGADDYLTKPFMTKELLARLRALTRRSGLNLKKSLSYGDICLDAQTQMLSCHSTGQSVRLGEKEFRLLAYFLNNRSQILTREQLAVKIWGYENDAEYNNVEVYLSFTRKKLAFVGSLVEIKAVRGVGYELRIGHV